MAGADEAPYSKLRRYTRVKADVPVGITCNARYRVHSAMELSEGGLLFTSTSRYNPGTPLELSLLLPDEKVLSIGGEVAYIFSQAETFHVGVRFLNLSEDIRGAIRIYVQKEKRR